MCRECANSEYKEFHSENVFTWCSNCGNYGIIAALKRALVAENLHPHDVLMCFDIGCNGNASDKLLGYRFHGLHGRVIPFACGAALANRRVKVIATGGDGGTLSEGINHLVHAIRSNYNITFILHNNLNYGLTKGQASASSKKGMVMNSAPDGVALDPLHVMNFVLGLNPSFAARTFSGDVKQMDEIIKAGIKHPGFAFIEILQSCPTYNKATPHEWYMQRVYDTISISDYDMHDLNRAREVAQDLEEHIATGVLYQNAEIPDFYERLPSRKDKKTELVDEVSSVDITELLQKFR